MHTGQLCWTLRYRIFDEGHDGLEHPGTTVTLICQELQPLIYLGKRRLFAIPKYECPMVDDDWGAMSYPNNPSHLQAIHAIKCRHPPQAMLPLTDTRLCR